MTAIANGFDIQPAEAAASRKIRGALPRVQTPASQGASIHPAAAADVPNPQIPRPAPRTYQRTMEPSMNAPETIRAAEPVNARLLEALKAAKVALQKVVEDCGGCEHEAGVCVCPELAAISQSGEAIAAAEAQRAGAESALRQLLSDLYDVAMEQRIHHRCRGDCPEPATRNFHWRDDECPACQVLMRVEAVLAERDDFQRAEAGG